MSLISPSPIPELGFNTVMNIVNTGNTSEINPDGHYLVFDESCFPQGAFDIEHQRKHYLMQTLEAFLIKHYKITLEFENLEKDAAIVESTDTTDHSRPWISVYYWKIPIVRLYYRESHYELHVLNPDLPESVCKEIALQDDMLINAVRIEVDREGEL